MGILSSMYTGVSGMRAQGEALGVIADNISNSQTYGFKASRAEFKDVIAKSLKGLLGGNQVGRGVTIAAVNPILMQGSVEATDKATDLAISGDGYFILKGFDGVTYSRDGSFHFDKEGYLVNNDEIRVQGFGSDENGNIINQMGDIRFPRALIPAKATEKVYLELNLDSREKTELKEFNMEDPYSTSHYATGIEIFDSQGTSHLVNMFFNKVGDGEWEYTGLVDGAEYVGGEKGKYSQAVKGKLTFNVDGLLESEEVTDMAFNFKGGAFQDQQIEFDFGKSITEGGKGIEGTKQYGAGSDLIRWNQNGSTSGTITNLSFNDEGKLSALYTNGEVRTLAQIALAKFENSESLFKVGSNRFKESVKSGEAIVGKANTNGRGSLFSKSIERSTVDLASEFVNMIQNQRAFQANAKTITTSDEILADVINLKR